MWTLPVFDDPQPQQESPTPSAPMAYKSFPAVGSLGTLAKGQQKRRQQLPQQHLSQPSVLERDSQHSPAHHSSPSMLQSHTENYPSSSSNMMRSPRRAQQESIRIKSSSSEEEKNGEQKGLEPFEADVWNQLVSSLDKNTEMMQMVAQTMQNISQKIPEDPIVKPPYVEFRRDDKVTVELKVTFLKINDIDTVNQQFEAEIFVQAKWEEPHLPSVQYGHRDRDGDDYAKVIPWDPKLIIMNVDGNLTLGRKSMDVRFHEPGYTYPVVLQLWRFKGFFKENLELEHFPVDVQDLTISISTERADWEMELIEDQKALSSNNKKAFMDAQEWTLYTHIETFRDFTTVEYCSSTVHPILHVQTRVARKMGYFIWNIVFIMLLIISLTFAAFTIEYNTADRLAVTITLFLTAVAFKLVVKQSLPTISYLTYLDMYVLAALVFLGIQAAQNACMNALGQFMDKIEVLFYDRWTMVSMAVLLFLFHVVFAIYIYRTASKRRRIMKEKDRMYESKREFLEKYGTLPPRYDTAMDVATECDAIIDLKK